MGGRLPSPGFERGGKNYTLYLPEDLMERAKEEAEYHGCVLSKFVAECIFRYFGEGGKVPQMSLVASKDRLIDLNKEANRLGLTKAQLIAKSLEETMRNQ